MASLLLTIVWVAHGIVAGTVQTPVSELSNPHLFPRPLDAHVGRLEVPGVGGFALEERPASGQCPEDLPAGVLARETTEWHHDPGPSARAPSIRFSFVRCVDEPVGRGRLQVFVTRSQPGHETTWRLFGDDSLGDGVVETGFSGFRDSDGQRLEQPRPPVAAVSRVPGLYVISFHREEVWRRGYRGIFEEWLVDLRPATPRVVARALWEQSNAPSSDYAAEEFSCSWDDGHEDFRCTEHRHGLSRSFWLTSAEPISADLEGTDPLDTASPGALVYVPRIGRTRLIARLGPATRLIGPPFVLVERAASGWQPPQSDERRPRLGWFEAPDASSVRVKEIASTGSAHTWDRMWEVETEDEHHLVAMPGPHSLRVGVRMDLNLDASSRLELGETPIVIFRRGDGFEALVQPPAGVGGILGLVFNGSEKACAYSADVRFDPRAGFTLGRQATQGPCERPMIPLVPTPRLGHMDTLLAEGVATGEWESSFYSEVFQIGGWGRVTTVVLDEGEADPWWEEMALALPRGFEVLRPPKQAPYMPDHTMMVPFALDAVSASRYAVVALGAAAASLPAMIASLPTAPVGIVLVEPRGLDPDRLGPDCPRSIVFSRDSAERQRWAEAGASSHALVGDLRSAVRQAVIAVGSSGAETQ